MHSLPGLFTIENDARPWQNFKHIQTESCPKKRGGGKGQLLLFYLLRFLRTEETLLRKVDILNKRENCFEETDILI